MQKKGKTIFLILIITFFLLTSNIVIAVTWDLLEENWNSMGTWELIGGGNIVSSISPAGYLYHYAGGIPVPPFYSIVGRAKDIGVLPTDYTVEIRTIIYKMTASSGYCIFQFLNGEKDLSFYIHTNKIVVGGVSHSMTNSLNTWYIWRLVCDTDGISVEVYRDEEFVHEFTSLPTYTPDDGTVTVAYGIGTYSPDEFEMRTDYTYIASGLHPYEPDVYVSIAFYFTEGGQFRLDNATFTNGTKYVYLNETVVDWEFQALTYNASWLFVNFTWGSYYNDTNPYWFNWTLTYNITVWCNFRDPPYGKLGNGIPEVSIAVLFVGALIVMGMIMFVLILSRKKK